MEITEGNVKGKSCYKLNSYIMNCSQFDSFYLITDQERLEGSQIDAGTQGLIKAAHARGWESRRRLRCGNHLC